jgi:hypothetical protein
MDLEDSYSVLAEEIAIDVWDMTLADVRAELNKMMNAQYKTVDVIHSLLYEVRIEEIVDSALSNEIDRQIDEHKENKHGAS